MSTHDWKHLRSYIDHEINLVHRISQFNIGVNYKFGVQVPRHLSEALKLDHLNGNTKWHDAMATEIEQIMEYKVFKDIGRGAIAPSGYKKITAHLVFDVKHDLRYKARLVAGGHLTELPKESIYSGVVSLRTLRLIVFVAELNGMDLWAADVGNAYLEAYTKEKVYIVAGPEFEKLQGHTLLFEKALYGMHPLDPGGMIGLLMP